MANKFRSKLFHGITGYFKDSIGIGIENPASGLHISGKDLRIDNGNAYFSNRPLVSGSNQVALISDITGEIDLSGYYQTSNPSGFITGITISEIEGVEIDNAVSGQTLIYNGSSWENKFLTGNDGEQSSSDNIDLLFNSAFATYYHEFAYNASGDLTGINVWDSDSKGSYLFSKELSYSGEVLTGIFINDEVNNNTLTKTLSYDSNDNLTSIKRIYT
jgi:hypothetical protein